MKTDLYLLADDESLKRWYFSAAGRWTSVLWSEQHYRDHLEIVYHPETRHPEDVFLSGAAGFDVSDAWSVIYEEHSGDVIRCLRRMAVHGHEPYDLWTQALTRLVQPSEGFPLGKFEQDSECSIPPSKIVEFQGRSSLRNYILLIAQNIGRDHRRRREIKYEHIDVSKVSSQGLGASSPREPAHVDQFSEVEEAQVQNLLVEALRCLTKNERRVLQAVAVLGMSNLEVSKMFGFSASSATRYRQSAVETLKQGLNSAYEEHEQMSDRVLEAASTFLRRTLQCLADGPST
jgi:RNA polymerase sigma factor (sigma-70 family)